MVTALDPTATDMTAMVSINIRSYSVCRFMLGLSLSNSRAAVITTFRQSYWCS